MDNESSNESNNGNTQKATLRKRLKKKLNAHKTDTPVKEIKVYPKQKCAVEGCNNNAVGKMDICKRHGGDPIIRENLIDSSEAPTALMNPSKYDPATHPMAFIELAKQGASEVECAAKFGVSVNTMRGWAEKFSDFNTAYEIGQALHEAWWLEEGKANLNNRSYNVGLYKFLTGNKLGYAEKTESKNLNVNAGVLMVPGSMSESEWEEKVGASKG